jgi:monoamine oxidase
MKGKTSRRQLLKTAALAGAGAAPLVTAGAAPPAPEGFPLPGSRRGRDADFIVVGAGPGGMYAAYLLKKAGASVIVLEANNRIGGRSFSIPLSNGGFIDVGAGWTGSGQPTIVGLAQELGLPLYPSYDHGQDIFVDEDGTATPFSGFDYPIPTDDLLELQGVILALDLMAEEVPLDAPWEAKQADEWDEQSVGIWLRDNVISDLARKLASINLETIICHHPAAVSLLHLLWQVHTFGGIQNYAPGPGGADELRVVGGTQQLWLRIAQRLPRRAIHLNSPVRQINQSDRSVEVVSDGGTFRARRVIVAAPLPLTGFIGYNPPLPSDRAAITQCMPLGTMWKIQFVYDHAWWRDPLLDWTGASFAIDGSFLTQTIDASGPGDTMKQPGILAGFAVDDAGRSLQAMTLAERRQALINEMVGRFGKQAGNLSPTITPNYVEQNWAVPPFTRGDPASNPGPRVLTALGFGPAIRAPVRRIHWAGTDTSTSWYGTMEGAATSAARAVQEALAAEGG